jgi:hypothetical protein
MSRDEEQALLLWALHVDYEVTPYYSFLILQKKFGKFAVPTLAFVVTDTIELYTNTTHLLG